MKNTFSLARVKRIFLLSPLQQLSLLLLVFTQFTFVANAQTKRWDKAFGGSDFDDFSTIIPTADGGFLLGGFSYSPRSGDKSQDRKGSTDYWVVKVDAAGKKVWDRTFGGTGADKLATIIPTADGGYLLGGSSESGRSGDKSQANRGSFDYWVVKINSEGQKQWDKTFGGIGNAIGDGEDYLRTLVPTADGGYLLGGYSNSDTGGDKSEGNKGFCGYLGAPAEKVVTQDGQYRLCTNDYWVVKIDKNGQKLWDKSFGGDYEDFLYTIVPTADGGYLLGGSSESSLSGDKSQANRGSLDYWVVKITSEGRKVWDKTFGGDKYDDLTTLVAIPDGGYLLGGYSYSGKDGDKSEANRGSDFSDYWVVKLDDAGRKVWDKAFGGAMGDVLTAIVATADGGYVLGGSSDSGIGSEKSEANRGEPFSNDYWILKMNGSGQKEWDKTVGGSRTDNLQALVVTPDGGYLLGGTSFSDADGDKSEANRGACDPYCASDYWLVKLSENIPPPVTAAWNLRYGGAATDRFTVVIQTNDGGYLAGGYSTSGRSGDKSQNSRGEADYWIIKTDAAGKKVWDQRYGGAANDYLNRIIQTADGGYLLAGSSASGPGGDKTEASRGGQDYWLVKISSTGIKQWDKTYGGTGFDDLRKVNQLADGGYILAGTSDSPRSGEKSQPSQGEKDFWVVLIDQDGIKRWDKTYGGAGDDYLESFTKTSGGGFLLAGSSVSGKSGDKTEAAKGGKDYWLVRIDQAGQLLWDKTYGGSGDDELYSIGQTRSGEYFVAGHSASGQSGDKSQASQGGSDYWMLMLNQRGEKLWDKSFGGDKNETLRAIIQSKDGGYILAGSSNSGISGDKSQTNQGGNDYWLVKTDAQGAKQWDQRFGGRGEEELRYVQETAAGGYILGGRSDSEASGDKIQPSQGGTDYWLVRVAPTSAPGATTAPLARVAAEEETAAVAALSLQAYPNPFPVSVTVSFTLEQTQPAALKVYDSRGREITTLYQAEAQSGKRYEIAWQPAGRLATGMYLIRLSTPSHTRQQKIIFNR